MDGRGQAAELEVYELRVSYFVSLTGDVFLVRMGSGPFVNDGRRLTQCRFIVGAGLAVPLETSMAEPEGVGLR
jgi:hypothetical protein